jgi:SAM-dependent methyltransferase
MTDKVKDQYERWPYPAIPRIASVPLEHLWQIHLNWIRGKCGLAPLKYSPKIWIAGCGTFQPYLFSRANPEAQIMASDLSQGSLRIARQRLKWHGLKNVDLQQINLDADPELPEGPFDFIECYGVLMCLPDPLKTLKNLSSRLKPDGILRVMVYPHYSRQRIFQIQRLAKLLELDYSHSSHPKILKQVINSLPKNHPLHYAFDSYWDSKNFAGIVDGFLHASDRGFSGFELCSLIDQAGLKPAFCFHRPWGQPSVMAQKLSALGQHNFSFWLHYLDLWQSLRSNFTLCLTKKELEQDLIDIETPHPLFDLSNPHLSLSYKARLLKLSLTGASLPSRTDESSISLCATQIKKLLWNKTDNNSQGSPTAIRSHKESWDTHFNQRIGQIRPSPHFTFRIGQRVLNPMYDYLFDAYQFDTSFNSVSENKLPNLETQIRIWENEAYPLENENIQWGLTPSATFHYYRKDIAAFLGAPYSITETTFRDFVLPEENKKMDQLSLFLKKQSLKLPTSHSQESLRKLWILLFGYDTLFLD